MKRKHVIIAVILAIVLIGALVGIMALKSYMNSIDRMFSELDVSNVDISKVPDGTFTGSYKLFPVDAEVKVTVNQHKITAIELVKHDNGRGAAAEVIPDKVIEAQSLDVDIISGATSSSKVILKAIEDALKNASK